MAREQPEPVAESAGPRPAPAGASAPPASKVAPGADAAAATPPRGDTTAAVASRPRPAGAAPAEVSRTDCCVVGGGPGGAMLALLLVRQGVRVTLLEQHHDFDRDFRGDTLHPSVMEILGQLGLAQRVLAMPHGEVHQASLAVDGQPLFSADFGHLPTRYPYITLVPQAEFLPIVVEEAKRYSGFELCLGAAVRELIVEDGVVRGVRYEADHVRHELRATLTVGADGRFSTVRRLAGIEPEQFSQAIDVLWFRVPRGATDPTLGLGRIGKGHFLAILPRHDAWQLGWVFPKGSYQRLRAAGLDAFKAELAATVPELRDSIQENLTDWRQVSLLSVEASHVRRWYRPGLLLIGDAAHVMSPIGGVGINYAIQDAVVAANVLAGPLRDGHVGTAPLVLVQLERELPTRVIQTIQNFIQRRLMVAINQRGPILPDWVQHVPVLRDLPARIIGFGLWRVHPREV
ncbi:MAG TPA: FAD-dependent oxidoreductase [Chloroflexota bacterium]|jgi:2-polyprenyl-6-methoxyphenol hydroxylase-like FAD-dependent oxidoreductase